MATSGTLQATQDPRFERHHAVHRHPECPERLHAIARAVADAESRHGTHFEAMEPRPATPDEILRVHTAQLLAQIEATAKRAPAMLDADTFVSNESFETALLAAGSTVELALRIARGDCRYGLAAVRPPGHHAESAKAMGFCLFNNVAVAARALQNEAQLDRILILDWDVHHGNGTQNSFEDDPSVLYFSTHQSPHYPGTGDAGEAGVGRGEGATVNVPMPAGCGDSEYTGLFQRVLAPVARQFRPQMILLSCGFDAHADDPLASMELTGEGFLAMTRIVRALADELCDGRILTVLEGGYAPSGLYEGMTALLEGLLEPAPSNLGALLGNPDLQSGTVLRSLVERSARIHGKRYPEIAASSETGF
jgi:acetoin utilization deacetylase AcuC-like enzyme